MTHKRILILNGHEAILEVVTEALQYEKFIVKVISLGRDLQDAIVCFQPDPILLDYKLPDTNGGDLCA